MNLGHRRSPRAAELFVGYTPDSFAETQTHRTFKIRSSIYSSVEHLLGRLL